MVELQFEKKLTRSDVEGRQHRIIIPKVLLLLAYSHKNLYIGNI